ncbi:anionic trypsin-1-like isoform X1 [Stylophora pistillata]|nr:anionic trypsin-1-like isoform X1 [Stylophora pistillata]
MVRRSGKNCGRAFSKVGFFLLKLLRLFLTIMVCVVFIADGCGIRTRSRIMGGYQAAPHSWPWQVTLMTPDREPFCGGTLLDEFWIATASHCLNYLREGDVIVRAGTHHRTKINKWVQDLRVRPIYRHPKYNDPVMFANDVALLLLDRPVQLNSAVRPICLPDKDDKPGTDCTVTGWGRLGHSGTHPDFLMQVTIPIVPYSTCQKIYPGDVHESMLCGGHLEGGKDACVGDSGRPYVCEHKNHIWKLEGIVSWGYGCGWENNLGVYTNVTHVRGWIKSVSHI